MTFRKEWTAILGLMALCGVAHGYPKHYAPFQKGEAPQPVPLLDCSIVKEQYVADDFPDYPSILYFTAPRDSTRTVLKMERLVEANSPCWRITALDRKRRPISTPATNYMTSYSYSVKSADLNQDGQTDFLVNIWTGGCGLAAVGSTTTFLLSSGAGYVATDYYSFDFGPEDIVRFKKGGPCYFIHNDLIGNGDEKTKDGRDHNFWVYQLYRFSRGKMDEANRDHARFPKWVWYTFKENHNETDQLTQEQKMRLLNPASVQPITDRKPP